MTAEVNPVQSGATQSLESVLNEAAEYLDPKYSMDDAYAVLGMQLEAVEALESPKSFGPWMEVGVDREVTKGNYAVKARAWLAKWLEQIKANACAWWKDNKDKANDKIAASLTPIVAAAIPQPWGAIAGIVAIVVYILIKSGFDAVCGAT